MGEDFHITKAGLLPFFRKDGIIRFCVMQPVAAKPELGAPPFQICKGTRMLRENGEWRDMRDGEVPTECETLEETALREAEEEIGLKRESIVKIINMGEVIFTSASKGTPKKMWLFAAEVANENCLLPKDQVASTTNARLWCTETEFMLLGRVDHKTILRVALAKLI